MSDKFPHSFAQEKAKIDAAVTHVEWSMIKASDLEKIKNALRDMQVPLRETRSIADSVWWVKCVLESQRAIINHYAKMTGIALVHNKVGKILEIQEGVCDDD